MIPTETEIAHFIELYQHRHFTRAAASLRVSQSALTQSISKLENKVGVPLFYRSKKGNKPTSAGEIFHRKAQQLIENWHQLTEEMSEDHQALVGKFRIGCHPSLGIYALPGFLKVMAEKAPKIDLILAHDYSTALTDQVISYDLDLAFVVNPEKQNDLILNKIYEDRIGLWKSKKMKESPRKIFTDMTESQARAFFGKRRTEFQDWKITCSTSLELVRAMVAEGVGVGILPERVANADRVGLELFDPTLPVSRDEIYVIYRNNTLKSNAGKALREFIRMYFKREK